MDIELLSNKYPFYWGPNTEAQMDPNILLVSLLVLRKCGSVCLLGWEEEGVLELIIQIGLLYQEGRNECQDSVKNLGKLPAWFTW